MVMSHVLRANLNSTQKAAANVQARNLYKVGNRSAAHVWAVTWTQEMPLVPTLPAGALNKLRTIATTYDMGDSDTPKIQSEQEFP
jgi:hypothetical protein